MVTLEELTCLQTSLRRMPIALGYKSPSTGTKWTAYTADATDGQYNYIYFVLLLVRQGNARHYSRHVSVCFMCKYNTKGDELAQYITDNKSLHSAPQSKSAVSTNKKHSRYFY